MARRLADALHPNRDEPAREPEEVDTEIDAVMTFSDREQLRGMDFEKMSLEELARAKAAIARLRLPVQDIPTRRFAPDRHGARADLRATLRAALRSGGLIELKRKSPRRRPPPLVVLCDISGSMSRYSRIFLHFMHTVTNDRDRVYTFVFGTRLTNITRYLRFRDVDLALERVGEAVADWSGGTRIGHSIAEFNRLWSRRLLGQGAIVMLITDGLDRDAGTGLAREMDRLHRSCRRLIWLNPLLRYEGFEPKSLGMRAMMPYVDEFRPVHNLEQPRRADRGVERGSGAARAGGPGLAPLSGEGGMSDTAEILEQAARWREAGSGVALATVVTTWGSSPRPVGAKLAVDDKGAMVGSVSGGCVEGAVVQEAQEVIRDGKPRLLDFGVSDDQAWEVGLACGGKIQIFVERVE